MTIEANKSLGQNFLIDQNIIQKIIFAIDPHENETLIEVGPGQGALTEHLLKSGAHILAVEKDPRMQEPLEKFSQEHEGTLELHIADAMKVNWSEILPEKPIKLVGNLPYNVGTQIVINAIRSPEHFSCMTFMLQKEVVERIVAKPNTSEWGRLGIWCHLLTDCTKLFDVPPGAFRPRPKVTSAIVQLTPLGTPRYDVDLKKMEMILRQAFSQRRKMLRSSLKGLLTEEQIVAVGIEPNRRPETLSTEEFCKLSIALASISLA